MDASFKDGYANFNRRVLKFGHGNPANFISTATYCNARPLKRAGVCAVKPCEAFSVSISVSRSDYRIYEELCRSLENDRNKGR